MPTVADVVEWVEREFPPHLAESWDAVGLVCGRPEAPVHKIVVTVDVTEEVVTFALGVGADFILAHHPLLLSGVHSVSATDFKGRILHRLIEAGCALMSAHTNADAADPGVSDALARAVGLSLVRPMQAFPLPTHDKVVVFVPESHMDEVLESMADAGAGSIGSYDRCAYWVQGEGTFRPLVGSDPYQGEVGRIENASERRLEMLSPRNRTQAVVEALMAAHPYEVPALDVIEL
ncbi:MAG: Nif3-like dinuclear metal center hexameric protein, partial [Actinomycetes bacterium]